MKASVDLGDGGVEIATGTHGVPCGEAGATTSQQPRALAASLGQARLDEAERFAVTSRVDESINPLRFQHGAAGLIEACLQSRRRLGVASQTDLKLAASEIPIRLQHAAGGKRALAIGQGIVRLAQSCLDFCAHHAQRRATSFVG